MKKLLAVFIIVFPILAFSQHWEVGPYLGASNYSGDFTEYLISMRETHLSYGVIARYNMNRILTIKTNIYRGMISGTDAFAKKRYHNRWDRNLSFRSKVLDIGIQPEINLKGFEVNSFSYKSSPYIFTGISIFRFNPQALYNEEWINLQPIGTEGQNLPQYKDRKYSLTQIAVPIGFGWKYSPGYNMTIGIEMSARKTFTDYLDDLSSTYVNENELRRRGGDLAVKLANRTGEVNPEPLPKVEGDPRGNPDKLDWYYFVGIFVTYSLLPLGCVKY